MKKPREPWDEKRLMLARMAVKRMDEEKKLLASMHPEERKVYLAAWAKRLASGQVYELSRIAKANGGCDCGQVHG